MPDPVNIFVSYAHTDNGENPLTGDGWVSSFLSFLKAELPSDVGRIEYTDVWMDRKLKINEPTDAQIAAQLDTAAIFLMIASNGYTASEYCMRRELKPFIARQLLDRIFIVERMPVDSALFAPHEFPGFDYADRNPIQLWKGDRSSYRPLNPGAVSSDKEPWYTKGWNLINQMADVIHRLRDAAPPTLVSPGRNTPSPALPPATVFLAHRLRSAVPPTLVSPGQNAPPPPPPPPTVFLAEPTDDLAGDLEFGLPRLEAYLEQARIAFVKPPSLFADLAAYRLRLGELMTGPKIFVQLFSDTPGRELARVENTVVRGPRVQLEAARAAGLQRLFWRSPNAQPERDGLDPLHTELLRGKGLLEGEEFYSDTVEKFAARIVELATAAVAPHAGAVPVGEIVVHHHQEDAPLAGLITSVIGQRGNTCSILSVGGDQEEDERLLKGCRVLLIVHGNAPDKWLRDRLKESFKARALRSQPMDAFGIYDGPPPGKPELEPAKLPRVDIIPARGTFNPCQLEDYLLGAGL